MVLFLEVVLYHYEFPSLLELFLLHSVDFGTLYFHLFQGIFWFLLWSFHWLIYCSVACCLISTHLRFFQFSSYSYCIGFLVSYHGFRKTCFLWLQSPLPYWDLLCGLTYDLSWRIVHVPLRRTCILLLLDRMLCRYVFIASGLTCQGQCFLLDSLSEWSIHWCEWNNKVPSVTVLLPTSPFRSVNICLIYLGAPMLSA